MFQLANELNCKQAARRSSSSSRSVILAFHSRPSVAGSQGRNQGGAGGGNCPPPRIPRGAGGGKTLRLARRILQAMRHIILNLLRSACFRCTFLSEHGPPGCRRVRNCQLPLFLPLLNRAANSTVTTVIESNGLALGYRFLLLQWTNLTVETGFTLLKL